MHTYRAMLIKLPPSETESDTNSHPQYYLHVKYVRRGDKMTCSTTIRAHACTGNVGTPECTLCKPCCESKQQVLKKHLKPRIHRSSRPADVKRPPPVQNQDDRRRRDSSNPPADPLIHCVSTNVPGRRPVATGGGGEGGRGGLSPPPGKI